MADWVELYNKTSKARLAQIRDFMNENTYIAFEQFNKILRDQYNLGYVLPRYTQEYGWTYSYGRSGYILVKSVVFFQDHFSVEGTDVFTLDDLGSAIRVVDELFGDGFLVRFAAFDEARTTKRNQKKSQNTFADEENKYKRNCIWCPKVSRSDLRKLYENDSLGIVDEELLDDIGLTIYVRCKTAKEIYDLMEIGKIKCMACGEIFLCTSKSDVIKCKCSREYTYHSYRKSFREDNMPRGAASQIFDNFTMDWGKAKTASDKMRLIDNLIHEFHVAAISGNKGRPVGVNLIQGTKKQIIELITELTYH